MASRLLAPLLLAVVIVVAAVANADPAARAASPSRAGQLAFMWAMAGQESGWDYFARNTSSGAFGKYQIMPFNWPNWAAIYLGARRADQTPANQERVAWGKLRDLYGWLGSWRRVAYWWLTGSSERNERRWSAYARGYVDNIMALRTRAPRDGGLPRVVPSGRALLSAGAWRRTGSELRLRSRPEGRPWAREGRLRDGAIVRIRATRTRRDGERWLRVVTADGRRGWVSAWRTVPAHAPREPRRWADVLTDGPGRRDRGLDRSHVRPRPR